MQVVIDISKSDYEHVRDYYENNETVETTYSYIYHGTVLPEEHGELKDVGQFDVVALYGKSDEFIDGVMWILEQIDKADTIIEATGSKGL